MKARDIMTSPVAVLHATESARDAAVVISRTGHAVLPVVADDGRMIGVVSESDVLFAGTSAPVDEFATRPVTDIMTTTVRSVALDTDFCLIAQDLLSQRLRCMPVVYEGRPVGLVCQRNVIGALVHEDDVIAARVAALLHDYAGSTRRWTVSVRSGVVCIAGEFCDEAERRVVIALARTEPGVQEVELIPTLPSPRQPVEAARELEAMVGGQWHAGL